MPKEVSFKISRIQFWVVAFLLLLLPIASKYNLLVFGNKTEGIVVTHDKVATGFSRLSGYDTFAVIEFTSNSKVVRMYGPENFNYDLGEKLTVYYNKNNPKECMVLNFAYLYTSSGAIIPFVLFLIWIAFYLAFKDKEKPKKTTPNNQNLLH